MKNVLILSLLLASPTMCFGVAAMPNPLDFPGQGPVGPTPGGPGGLPVIPQLPPVIIAPPDPSSLPLTSGSAYSTIQQLTLSSGSILKLIGGTASRDVDVKLTSASGGPNSNGAGELTIHQTGTTIPVSDLFVLQMSYNEAAFIQSYGSELVAQLGWYNPSSSQWVPATAGNTGGAASFAGNTAYNPATHFTLGTYGVDTAANTVWAVINHNSSFGVIPEPSSLLMGAAGCLALAVRRRRKA